MGDSKRRKALDPSYGVLGDLGDKLAQEHGNEAVWIKFPPELTQIAYTPEGEGIAAWISASFSRKRYLGMLLLPWCSMSQAEELLGFFIEAGGVKVQGDKERQVVLGERRLTPLFLTPDVEELAQALLQEPEPSEEQLPEVESCAVL